MRQTYRSVHRSSSARRASTRWIYAIFMSFSVSGGPARRHPTTRSVIADLAGGWPVCGPNAFKPIALRGAVIHVTTHHVPCERKKSSHTRNASSQSSSTSLTHLAKNGEIVRSFRPSGEHVGSVRLRSSPVRVRYADDGVLRRARRGETVSPAPGDGRTIDSR